MCLDSFKSDKCLAHCRVCKGYEEVKCQKCSSKTNDPMMSQVSAFERKLSTNPESVANYEALTDRAKRVLLDHFAGLRKDVVIRPPPLKLPVPEMFVFGRNVQPTLGQLFPFDFGNLGNRP